MSQTNATRLFPLVILVAGVAAYHNSFSAPFVFDDDKIIVLDERIRHLWPFQGATTLPQRSFFMLTLALNYALGGLRVEGYHAVNLAIHLLGGLTLYGLVRRTLLLEPRRTTHPAAAWLALASALLWVVHPLQTESVTYVVQRAESLMGLLYLLTLYCVLRGATAPSWCRWYAAAVVSCTLGMATKEVMCTAPLVVLLFDRTFLAPSWREVFRRRGALYLGLFSTWAVLLPASLPLIVGIRPGPAIRSGDSAGFAVAGLTPWEYLRSQPGILIHYLKLAFWPHHLCLDYDWPVARGAAEIVPAALAVIGLLLLTVWALWRWPRLGFLGAAFFLILAPTSSVMPIKDLAVEHRMYLPLAPLAVGVVLAGHALFELLRRRAGWGERAGRRLAVTVVLGVVVCLGWLTIRRNEDYRDPVAVWSAVVAERPANPRGRENLARSHTARGVSFAADGNESEAVREFRAALEVKPDLPDAWSNLGVIFAQRGANSQAEDAFRMALRSDPENVEAAYNLGVCLLRQGKDAEGIDSLRAAVRLQPGHTGARYHLGKALAQRGQTTEAAEHLRAALRSRPGHAAAHYALGVCLVAEGKEEEALEHFRAAARLNPGIAIPSVEELKKEKKSNDDGQP